MSGRGHKQKGDNYERELAAFLNDNVFKGRLTAYRAPLSGGGRLESHGGADLVGTPLLFVEAKRTEKFRLHEAMRQATYNAGVARTPDFPVVINRQNRMATGDSIVAIRLKDFCRIYHAALVACGVLREDDTRTDQEQTKGTAA